MLSYLLLKSQHTLKLIAKILRNDANFREITRLDDMTINELKFYSQILPIYKNILKKADIEDDDVAPRFYYGFYGFDKGLYLGIHYAAQYLNLMTLCLKILVMEKPPKAYLCLKT